jgi:hypothetical protein
MPESAENFKFLVALFLAEELRSRHVTINRAAEISSLVVEALPQLSNEETVLTFLTQIEHEFEEVGLLKQALCFNYQDDDINVYTKEIKDFAAQLFESDMVASATFLQNAASPGMTIQKLCIKHPDFCQSLLLSVEKTPLLKRLDLAY